MIKSFFGKPIVHVFLIMILGVVVYSNTFTVPFQWDENVFLRDNPLVKDFGYFLEPSKAEGFKFYEELRRRYFGYLTFALNYRLNRFDVEGYHAVNNLVHVLNALLVYWLVVLIFASPVFENSELRMRSGLVALFTALLFVSHPVQTEAVTYIYQRFASLAAFCYLLSVASYMRARVSLDGKRKILFYALSLVSAVLAMKTKEHAVTLPLVIVLVEILFLRGSTGKRVLYLLPVIMTLFIIPLSVIDLEKPFGEALDEATKTQEEITRYEYFVTQPRVVVTYIRLLMLPFNQNLDYDYPVYSSMTSPAVLASVLLLAGLLCIGTYLIRKSPRGDPVSRIMMFAILWFLIALSVESSVIALADVIFEHRLYLPSVGIFLLAAAVPFSSQHMAAAGYRRIAVSALVLVVVAFSFTAHLRNGVWHDRVTFWEDVTRKSPNKARTHVTLGTAYGSAGRYEESVKEFERAISLNPEYAFAHYSLGWVYGEQGKYEKAQEHFERAIGLNPEFAHAHNGIGSIYLYENKIEEAVRHLQDALRLEPELATANYNMGLAYAARGMREKAILYFISALKLDPAMPEAHYNLGLAYLQEGRERDAVEEFEAELRINPDHPWARKFVDEIIYEPYK